MRKTQLKGKTLSAVSIGLFCLLLSGCASTGQMTLAAGDLKNTLPVVDRDLLAEVRTIAVPPLFQDKDDWQKAVASVLSSSKKISVITVKGTDTAAKNLRKNLSAASPEERGDLLAGIARSVNADAVINGMLLTRDDQTELILQLLSAHDARMLWQQAVEFRLRGERVSADDQKAVITSMAASLISAAGKKQRSAVQPLPPEQAPDDQQKQDAQPKSDRKPKPERRQDRDQKPAPSTLDIGPM